MGFFHVFAGTRNGTQWIHIICARRYFSVSDVCVYVESDLQDADIPAIISR